MSGTQILLIVLIALVLVVPMVVLTLRRRRRRGADPVLLAAEPEDRPLPAVVLNPTKFPDLDLVRAQISEQCVRLGWADPIWFETTIADPGRGQALAALQAGADVVLACGGDGTLRKVAQGMTGSGVAMGVVPAGTGNLLARNLGMILDDVPTATRIALSGDDRTVDVGRLLVDDRTDDEVFLVMAGMGFDAAIMAGAGEELKSRVGPMAYVISGARSLFSAQAKVSIAIDDQPAVQRRIRTVVVGNCGRLLGGMVLMPAAELDDGRLDIVTIAPKGFIGWLAVAARVLTRQRKGHRLVDHWQGTVVTVTADSVQQAQLDGDVIGDATRLQIWVDPGALVLRVAHPRPPLLAPIRTRATHPARQSEPIGG